MKDPACPVYVDGDPASLRLSFEQVPVCLQIGCDNSKIAIGTSGPGDHAADPGKDLPHFLLGCPGRKQLQALSRLSAFCLRIRQFRIAEEAALQVREHRAVGKARNDRMALG